MITWGPRNPPPFGRCDPLSNPCSLPSISCGPLSSRITPSTSYFPPQPPCQTARSRMQSCTTLEGACCPTQQGVYLGCCGSVHVAGRKHSNSSAPPPTTPTKTSSSKSAGGEVKVDGGVDDEAEEEEGPGDDRDCANHPGCSDLRGDCCPSPDGTMLSCCSDL